VHRALGFSSGEKRCTGLVVLLTGVISDVAIKRWQAFVTTAVALLGVFMFPRIPADLLTGYPVTPKINRAFFNVPEGIASLEPTLQSRRAVGPEGHWTCFGLANQN
jgi:hypothetical protein